MYEFILVTHIVSMIASMGLMSGAVVLGAVGKKFAVHVATSGMYVTVIGFMTGVGMLMDAPLTMKCAMLTAYLVAATTLYYVGFGLGRVEKARFIRQS